MRTRGSTSLPKALGCRGSTLSMLTSPPAACKTTGVRVSVIRCLSAWETSFNPMRSNPQPVSSTHRAGGLLALDQVPAAAVPTVTSWSPRWPQPDILYKWASGKCGAGAAGLGRFTGGAPQAINSMAWTTFISPLWFPILCLHFRGTGSATRGMGGIYNL